MVGSGAKEARGCSLGSVALKLFAVGPLPWRVPPLTPILLRQTASLQMRSRLGRVGAVGLCECFITPGHVDWDTAVLGSKSCLTY